MPLYDSGVVYCLVVQLNDSKLKEGFEEDEGVVVSRASGWWDCSGTYGWRRCNKRESYQNQLVNLGAPIVDRKPGSTPTDPLVGLLSSHKYLLPKTGFSKQRKKHIDLQGRERDSMRQMSTSVGFCVDGSCLSQKQLYNFYEFFNPKILVPQNIARNYLWNSHQIRSKCNPRFSEKLCQSRVTRTSKQWHIVIIVQANS